MPELGWVGLDPTNNVIARHATSAWRSVAITRTWPPTRGVYKGASAVRSELAVAVRIGPVQTQHVADAVPFTPWMSRDVTIAVRDTDAEQQQQQ